MTCTEEYREHIEYTFHAFCKVVIRNATINAARTRSRKHKREISLEYLTDEKHYPLGTTDEYFQAPEPDEEYTLTLCGDTVIFSNALLVEALSRLDTKKREMVCLTLSAEEERPIGIWGQRHKRYLKEYKNVTYTTLLISGKLNSYLVDINEQAQERLETLIEQMKQAQGVTEQLKAENAFEWIGRMNNIRACAVEIVNTEIIYA